MVAFVTAHKPAYYRDPYMGIRTFLSSRRFAALVPSMRGAMTHLIPSRTFLPSAIADPARKMAETVGNIVRAAWRGLAAEMSVSGVAAPKAKGPSRFARAARFAPAPAKGKGGQDEVEGEEDDEWRLSYGEGEPTIRSNGRFSGSPGSGGWGDRKLQP